MSIYILYESEDMSNYLVSVFSKYTQQCGHKTEGNILHRRSKLNHNGGKH